MKIDASCWPDVQLATDEMISFLKKVLQEAARLENVKASTEISLVFTDDAHIKEINRNSREKDQATDVLSFAFSEGEEPEAFWPDEVTYLGEIFISVETARKQAQEYDHSLEREIAFLGIHGLLHLLGYDHELGPDEERKMFERQNQILETIGVKREGAIDL